MSKLSHIQRILENSPNIDAVGSDEQKYLRRKPAVCHKVTYLLAPKRGVLYTAEELNDRMAELVPDLEPTYHYDFSEAPRRKGRILQGSLEYHEKISKEELKGMFPYKKHLTGTYWRVTFLRLVSSTRYARYLLDQAKDNFSRTQAAIDIKKLKGLHRHPKRSRK